MTEELAVTSETFNHVPVLVDEVLHAVDNIPSEMLEGGLVIDATVGGGGHSALLLEKYPMIRLIGLDQDENACLASSKRLCSFGSRVEIIPVNFAEFVPPETAICVLADLGVSSPQFDLPDRGFSFQVDGPLDMRMNQNTAETAADLIARLDQDELADLIYEYGEERFSRRIARRIKHDLSSKGPYKGTLALAYAISGCYPPKMRFGRIHPATRTFQAIRIAVNNEMKVLDRFLTEAPAWLDDEGLLGLISFHSLEDRKVKYAFRRDDRLTPITRKPIQATSAEISKNPRARSAKFRTALKRVR